MNWELYAAALICLLGLNSQQSSEGMACQAGDGGGGGSSGGVGGGAGGTISFAEHLGRQLREAPWWTGVSDALSAQADSQGGGGTRGCSLM